MKMEEILCCLGILRMVVWCFFCLTNHKGLNMAYMRLEERRTVLSRPYNKVGRMTLLRTLILVLVLIMR